MARIPLSAHLPELGWLEGAICTRNDSTAASPSAAGGACGNRLAGGQDG